jgi:hypothetical protein
MRQREIDKLNRESEALWRKHYERVNAKVGTIPMSIWISHADATLLVSGEMSEGYRLKFTEGENGQGTTGYVTKIGTAHDPLFIFVNKM